MSTLKDIQELATKKVPNIETGLTVRVHQKIKEGEKERVQIFEGLVIKVNSGHGADKSFTVRKVVEGIGVEKIFPLFSANIVKIEVKKKSKIRRAKLYYMRDRSGKSARLKESFISEKDQEEAIEELAEQKAAEETAVEETAVETTETPEVQTEAERQEEIKEEVAAEETPAEESVKEEDTKKEETDEKKED